MEYVLVGYGILIFYAYYMFLTHDNRFEKKQKRQDKYKDYRTKDGLLRSKKG